MKLALVQIYPWDRPSLCKLGEETLEIGQNVIIETESGQEIGRLLGFKYLSEEQGNVLAESANTIVGPADLEDCRIIDEFDKEAAVSQCQKYIEQCQLEMKLVDAAISGDGRRLTFAFTAEGRVDFRELVRLLTRNFNCQIRLQQIGTRDEAKIFGGQGVCGRGLCCRGFLTELNSVTSDMAEVQGINHRGSDRISGICGRLMCCLAYEAEGYQEMARRLPPLGGSWQVDGQSGTIINRNILKGTFLVEINDQQSGRIIVEVNPNEPRENGGKKDKKSWLKKNNK
ncbi:MAG TPA: regulatory iron-sulfur-containing complex subunit RicT [bacterium]|nr:regulatory iron-sulfur-containing complex subunit RicT [bacterium]